MNSELDVSSRSPTGRITMTDVAREAGVSQTTVSLVLNEVDGARVSLDTRAKVRAAAERLAYRVPRRERAGAGRDDLALIGVLVDEIASDPWTAMIIDGVGERARERDIGLAIALTGGDPGSEQAALARWDGLPLLGIVYATINTREVPPLAIAPTIPVVLVNCYARDRSLPSIVPGEVAGGHRATERLIRAGHRRIGYIGGEPWMDASRARLEGYRQALATGDLPFDPDLVRHGDWRPSSGYGHTLALLQVPRAPTAIFCCNDLMALGCFDALKQTGRRIPEDVAVVGYDDREIAQHLHPALTTILLPHGEMGALAAEWLLDTARRPHGRPPQIKIECPLIERDSVRTRAPERLDHPTPASPGKVL